MIDEQNSSVAMMYKDAASIEAMALKMAERDPKNAGFLFRVASIAYLRVGNLSEGDNEARALLHELAAKCSINGGMPDLAIDLVTDLLTLSLSADTRNVLTGIMDDAKSVAKKTVEMASADPEDIENVDVNRLCYLVMNMPGSNTVRGKDNLAYRIRCMNSLINITGSNHDRNILQAIINSWKEE